MNITEACVTDLRSAKAAIRAKRLLRSSSRICVSKDVFYAIVKELRISKDLSWWVQNNLLGFSLDGHRASITYREIIAKG